MVHHAVTDAPAVPSTSAGDRWFGVGHGTAADTATAGAQAARAAVAGREAALLLVLASTEHDFAGLHEGIRAHAGPDTAIVGGSTCGEVTRDGSAAESVIVIAVGGPGLSVRTAISRNAADRQREAGIEVAEGVGSTGRPNEVLVLLPDGLIGRQHDVVRGAYSVLGAGIPMTGGCSGNLTYSKGYQFFGDRSGVEVLTGSVVAALIGSDGPIGVGVAHGWRATGAPMNVTSSEDNRVFQIDHKPALDVYLDLLGADDSVTEDPAGFFTFTHAHPLGLARRSGEDIRVIKAADLTDRSVTFFADVPQGSLVWLMATDPDALIDGGADSCRQAVDGLGGAAPIGVIEFDCAVRQIQLGPDGVAEEIARMSAAVGDVPLVGMYSMGEVARVRGTRGMHNMTSVSLAFG